MNIGIPKEIKVAEHRVSVPPSTVRESVNRGHIVFVESNAGMSSGFNDEEYIGAGATILDSAEDVWANSDMIIKVKEPQAERIPLSPPRSNSLHLPTPGRRPST